MNQPLAYIHPQAKIANNVVVEPFVTIHKNVEIGEGSWIGSNVTIMEGARIGKNCRVFPGAVIAAVPQDLKFGGEESLAVIGDNTTIRECVTINRGTSYSGKTEFGINCLIMAYAHIAHDCIIETMPLSSIVFSWLDILKSAIGLIIGGLTAVHQFVKI